MSPKYQGASTEAIQHHYDVGNEFYGLWLDPSRTYSAALWEDDDDLEKAQQRKLDHHIMESQAANATRVLDIGCGWGALLNRLVKFHNVEHAVGLTLSDAQFKYIQSQPHPNIEVRLENWADYVPEGPVDAIISIGAFEHFATPELSAEEKLAHYRHFLQCCHKWLKPGGRLSLQSIIYENAGVEDLSSFITTEIFPDSNVPHLSEIIKAAERRFEVVRLRNDRDHYTRTLRAWLKNLKAHRKEAIDLVGEQEVKKYEKYLSISMMAFHSAGSNLSRITFQKLER